MTSQIISPTRLAWLESEIAAWRGDGLLDEATATTIRSRYVAGRGFSVVRIVLWLGAAFVAAGLVWLVASNLDQLSPLVRFLLLVAIWLGLVLAAELVATRREAVGDVASPVVGAVRLLAGAAFGPVVFQAAQSLQVPAFEAFLLGAWGIGTLAYAYAVRGVAPIVLGIGLTAMWFVWETGSRDVGKLAVSGAFLVVGVLAAGVAVAHAHGWWPQVAAPWRDLGAALSLVGLFMASLPFDNGAGAWPLPLRVGLVLVAGVVLFALGRGDREDHLEVGLGLVALVAGVGLALWRTGDPFSAGGSSLPRAVVAVLCFLLVASGYAVAGAWRSDPRLTLFATAGLVVFVTVQSFAVFAPLLSGAVLFLAVGIVLLVSGVLADRGRRRLIEEAKAYDVDGGGSR